MRTTNLSPGTPCPGDDGNEPATQRRGGLTAAHGLVFAAVFAITLGVLLTVSS